MEKTEPKPRLYTVTVAAEGTLKRYEWLVKAVKFGDVEAALLKIMQPGEFIKMIQGWGAKSAIDTGAGVWWKVGYEYDNGRFHTLKQACKIIRAATSTEAEAVARNHSEADYFSLLYTNEAGFAGVINT
jgi:hypothetical protein